MKVALKVWRQSGPNEPGQLVRYDVDEVSPDMSFLEMLDVLNERLLGQGERAIAFDHDCREGICGSCSMYINGRAHGPHARTTVCQLHMRSFADGDTITVEPWRAKPFPILRDLIVDRSAFDRIVQAGGFIGARAGSAPEANSVPVPKPAADLSMDAAACIGCGACVAACPNASAALFVAAKVSHLGLMPQGQPERLMRVERMVATMDEEGFGSCTSHGECEAVCPKGIPIYFIARMNRDRIRAAARGRDQGASET